jgi:hypothetical protein
MVLNLSNKSLRHGQNLHVLLKLAVPKQMVRFTSSIHQAPAYIVVACLDNAKEESHQLDNQKVEQDRKTNQQEQELKDAKDRMERHCKILERHAKDVDAAQAKIPKGMSPCSTYKDA